MDFDCVHTARRHDLTAHLAALDDDLMAENCHSDGRKAALGIQKVALGTRKVALGTCKTALGSRKVALGTQESGTFLHMQHDPKLSADAKKEQRRVTKKRKNGVWSCVKNGKLRRTAPADTHAVLAGIAKGRCRQDVAH